VAADGKLVAAGSAGVGICLVRLNTSDGSPDTSLGSDGVKVVLLGSGTGSNASSIAGFAIQPDGKFVIGGALLNGSTLDAIVARFGAGGTLDLGFSGGFVSYNASTINLFQALAMDTDGRIVSAGFTGASLDGAHDQLALVRYWP
jgi:uncharacterized delta-60 repeat protein